MACCIPVSSIDDVIRAIATVDMMHVYLGRCQDEATLSPGDDYFLAPYQILCKDGIQYSIVFAGYKVRESHINAVNKLKQVAPEASRIMLFDCVSRAKYRRGKAYGKLRPNAWAGGDDVSQALYQTTMETCAKAFKSPVPADWMTTRANYVSKWSSVEKKEEAKTV